MTTSRGKHLCVGCGANPKPKVNQHYCEDCTVKYCYTSSGRPTVEDTPEIVEWVLAEPFRIWLERQIVEIGLTNVASAIGVTRKELYDARRGRRNMMRLQQVDRFVTALGGHYLDIYDEDDVDTRVRRQR